MEGGAALLLLGPRDPMVLVEAAAAAALPRWLLPAV